MKTGSSLRDLATEIERQDALKFDAIVHGAALTTLVDFPADQNRPPEVRLQLPKTGVERVDSRSNGLGIRPVMHGQLADKLGIPKKYYDRMQAEAPALLLAFVWMVLQPWRLYKFLRSRMTGTNFSS